MLRRRLIRFTPLLVLLAARSSLAGALEDYVARPDPSYAWHEVARFERKGAEIIVLNLDSQTWHGVLWKHRMYLIKPRGADLEHGLATLIIGGGRWHESYATEVPSQLPPEAGRFLEIAERLGGVVAVLGQVPFQPLFGLTEDQLIAYSFSQYLQTHDPTWPLLLPMVKSVVRAMDTVESYARNQWKVDVEAFTLLGGSKRGWTTWLTGAVDPRAKALAPVVIDALNFEQHFPHQVAMWGAPSESIRPYTERNLTKILAAPAGDGAELRSIVDPYSYREKLTQPKLIVSATNDSYFPVDSMDLYWNGLEGEKYALYLPNDKHNISDYGRLIPTLAALNRHVESGTPLPQLAWEFRPSADAISLCVRSDMKPSRVRAWVAHSDDLDFRDEEWNSSHVRRADTMIASVERPAAGYTALFIELQYGRFRRAYTLSTNLRIFGAPGISVPEPAPATAAVCPSSL